MPTGFPIRWLRGVLLSILLFSFYTRAAPIAKRVISQIGDTGVFCNLNPGWSDVATFFLTNYLIHIFTVKSDPGNGDFYTYLFAGLSVIFPYAGVLRACRKIEQAAVLDKKGQLDWAARAGALCVVARTKGWKTTSDPFWCLTKEDSPPLSDMVLDNQPLEFLPDGFVSIHGEYCLPPGYMMARLPVGAVVKPFRELEPPPTIDPTEPSTISRGFWPYNKIRSYFESQEVDSAQNPSNDKAIKNSSISTRKGSGISCSHNFLASLAGIGQLYFAVASIYKASINQIDTFGYAAYSLTVIPYALMTAVNLIALVITPDYPAVYMVESSIMVEARSRGGLFTGTVGVLDEVEGDTPGIPSDKQEPCPWEVKLNGKQKYRMHEIKAPAPDQPVKSETTAVGTIILGNGLPTVWDPAKKVISYPKFIEWLIIFYVVVMEDQMDEFPGLRLYYRFRNRDLRDIKPSPYRVLYRLSNKGNPSPKPQVILPRIGRFKYNPLTSFDRSLCVASDLLLIGVIISPYIIIYALTGYNPQKSTFSERFWVTLWMVFGQLAILVSIMWTFVDRFMSEGLMIELRWGLFISLFCGAVWMVPAFGGFVVVARMILKFNICESF